MADTDRDILPAICKPVNYDISLHDLEFGGAWSYQGTVTIDLKMLQATKEFVLNAKELKVLGAEVSAKDSNTVKESSSSVDISYDKQSERVTLKFDQEVPAGDAILAIQFSGTINDSMAGFSRAKYKSAVPAGPQTPSEDGFSYMFSTQFESCDARRAFPCFDEPNLKSTFDFEIEVPKELVVLSNMPEKNTRAASKSDLKVVSFEKTPIMSTYLLAWAIGDFEYVEAHTDRKYNGKNIPVRVYTTRGLKDQGRFALQCARQTIDYFSDIFQIEYPLPKADLLAVHEFAMGAMENWGLVTYRTTAVLFDDEKSDTKHKNRVAYVVAHELAHQWFGNLVTMNWWNELWLNEGFATWVGWLAVHRFFPEWDIWGQFVAEATQPALQLDGLRASHPIEVPVRNALEVDQIFDAISYFKGSSVIRMLSNHLGQEVFLQGVAEYLKANAYGNSTTKDLWTALSAASGEDVAAFMEPWIQKIGYPVLTVEEELNNVNVRQSRFLSTGDTKPEEDETLWWIPLGLKTGVESDDSKSKALTARTATLEKAAEGFYKINSDTSGFYRTNYPPARLAHLSQNQSQLTTEDKIGLIADAAALAVAGEATTAGLLSFAEGFQKESSYQVWFQLWNSLTALRSVFASDKEVSAGLDAFVLKLAGPAAEAIGWEPTEGEDYLHGQSRRLLLDLAGSAGHEGIIAEAKRRFQLWSTQNDSKAVSKDLRSVIFSINVSNGGSEEYQAVKMEYLNAATPDGKETCLRTLGKTQDPALAQDYIEFVLSGQVPMQDIHTAATALAGNNKLRGLLWQAVKDKWDFLSAKLSSNGIVLDRFLRTGLSKFADHATEQDIAAFFKDKDTKLFHRSLVIISDTIRGNASYKDRDAELVLEWLKAHSYA